ncbi:MAG TPA: alpha/beta hydrolase [Anaerolineaceae bacterium]|nr:alpha/beta hydrolase [Anaerolineaceae bacterium]
MKLDFSNMDVGTLQFNFARTLMVAPTGGAEVSDCLKAAARIQSSDPESWVQEWAALAWQAGQTAGQKHSEGNSAAARNAFLRASNYYRAAMFSMPPTDERLDEFIRLSRESFQRAAGLFDPPIEVVEIPFEGARLPGYFLSGGSGRRPTLLVINGFDSTNEEMVHWIGLTARSRGWNCLVFEGPGQWSAFQMNPHLYLRPDFEVPVKAVVDYLVQREDVDAKRIALIGYSLGSQLAARVAAFEKRICACVCFGGIVVDVAEAWEAVMPAVLRSALPGLFDAIFTSLEKVSPQLRGFANHSRWDFGVSKPHELLAAWKGFNIKGLASQIECPVLILMGEGEYQQTDTKTTLSILRFVSELLCPAAIHELTFSDGWAASHCSVGDEGPANQAIFSWLEHAVVAKDLVRAETAHDWSLLKKYQRSSEIDRLLQDLRVSVV